MHIKTQKFLVMGVSKSGYSVSKYILENGGQCYVYEQLKSPKIDVAIEELTRLGAMRVDEQTIEDCLKTIDVIILSPGVPINHEVAIKAKQLGKRIVGELEFGFLQFSPPTIAVTGTNGKTTTVTLIDSIFKDAKIKSQLVGNVGIPISSKLSDIDKNSICVAEVSSFQLESVNAFCPHVTCVLNVSPDHLERHYSMENYIFLKKRIFKNQRESEYTVLNYDDSVVRGFFTQTKAKVVWVSVKEKVEGAYRQDGKLYFNEEYIISENQLAINGEHNVCDVLFAIASAKLMGVKNENIHKALAEFKGVRHRIEKICEKNGVIFYNDSKSTNTFSTLTAIDSIKGPIVLILGGSEKGETYDELFEKIKKSNVIHTVLTGASRYNMLESAGKVGYSSITVTPNFDYAVRISALIAKEGQSVLLSPACASFDAFSDYEERGDRFISLVEGL